MEVLGILNNIGALIVGSHIVYTSGRHGAAYVNKDAVYPHVRITSDLCREIAEHFSDEKIYGIEAVAAPAVGGVILATWTAYWLQALTGRKALMVYADKDGDNFVFKRGYDKLIPDRRVLVVEDVLTTGGSAKKVVEAVRSLGGKVLGVGVLCNRGGITAQDLGDIPELFALTKVNLDSWPEEECPLCRDGVPINIDVGKGREFLARKATE